MSKTMEGRVALVTGGGSGIGAATCRAFAALGAKVMVADIRASEGESIAAELQNKGAESGFVRVDVAKESDVASMVAATVSRFGRLDFAHNNAGINQDRLQTVVEIEEDYWDKIISINLKSVFLGMKHEIPALLKNGGGAIVNTSSGAGIKGVPNLSAYVASKFGVVGLTKSTALDFADKNIRVNAVCPGPIATRMIAAVVDGDPALGALYRKANPMGRFGEAEEVANAVVWLCSSQASYATGMIMTIDGGFSAN